MSEMSFPIMFLIGFFAEYIDGALGMAYGVTAGSFLIAIGIMPAVASASIHFAEIFTTFFAGVSHIKLGNFRKDIALPMIIPGMVGGAMGAYLLSSIPGETTRPVIALLLLGMGAIVFLRFAFKKQMVFRDEPVSKWWLVPLGFVAAFCDACAGGGWGPIATPTLLLSNKSVPRKVVGSVDTSEFFVTLAIAVTFMITLGLERFRWDWVVALLLGGVLAAPIAAYTCKRVPGRLLGVLVGVILILTNARTLLLL